MNLCIASLLMLIIANPIRAQETRTYTNSALGLSMTVPADWRIETNRRLESKFVIPTSLGQATVDLFPSSFRQDAELWQKLQNEISRQLDRQVERQWQEILLGVPLLLTKVNYPVGGEPTTTLIGLLYSATPTKFHFRLTSSSRAFGEAEAAWRDALVTLRTTTGVLPATEDPNRPAAKSRSSRDPQEARPISGERRRPPLKRPRTFLAASIVDRAVRLYHPADWSFEREENGYIARRRGLKGVLRVRLRSRLDSPAADRVLAEAAAAALARFASVERRIDTNPMLNAAGATVSTVLRQGTGTAGALVVWHAVGVSGDLFWEAVYEGTDEQYRNDRGFLGEWSRFAAMEAAG